MAPLKDVRRGKLLSIAAHPNRCPPLHAVLSPGLNFNNSDFAIKYTRSDTICFVVSIVSVVSSN
jgi:hypothetical protein